MLNIVLFGPPGAGKGTQSEKLIAKYKLVHLSTGDILRNEIKNDTVLGRKAQEFVNQGLLVSDEVVIGMIDNKINQNAGGSGFIFDGFPRTVPQAEALDILLNTKGTPITKMIALEVEEDVLMERLLIRGKDSGRPDDQNPEIVAKRIKIYKTETLPVANYYLNQNKFKAIIGIGAIDEIFQNICHIIDQTLV